MGRFSVERALRGCAIETRCGFEVTRIDLNTGDPEFPIAAIVMEVVKKEVGRRRRKRIETTIEPCMTMYHSDGRLHEDKDDDWDLVIVDDEPCQSSN